MAGTLTSPSNTNSERVDSVQLTTNVAGLVKGAVPGSSVASTGGGDTNLAAQMVGTHTDDAAFGVATAFTGTVVASGYLADQTAPDSVDEGDIGIGRMTLDRLQRVVTQQRSPTSTKANISGAAASTTLLASNALRTGATIWNDSTAILYVDLTGGTASATSCTVKLIADAYYEVPYGYHGLITGIWASATGSGRVTEFSAQ